VAGVAVVFAVASGRTATRSVQVSPTTYLTLNGRTNIWKSTLNSPADWVFGRGVGATGTASQRATRGLTSSSPVKAKGGSVVDSSYFAVIADVGIVGLALLIALFARIFLKARAAAARGERSGWLAMGLLAVTLLDAMTRESFTAFPTAYLALLLVGVAWAAWSEEPAASEAVAT
jgi:O-antigen ligase